jgi:hypothetical protein
MDDRWGSKMFEDINVISIYIYIYIYMWMTTFGECWHIYL